MRKHTISILLASLILLSFLTAAEAQDGPVTIYNSWVIPKSNITILDDTFYLQHSRENPELLILHQDGESIILKTGEEKETQDYIFRIVQNRFDLDRLDVLNGEGVPLYGTMDKEADEPLQSYHLQVDLLRPLIEIKHIFNDNRSNSRPANTFSMRPHEPLRITTELLNRGMREATFVHKEPIDSCFRLHNHSPSAEKITDEKGRINLLFSGTIQDSAAFSYTVIPDKECTVTMNASTLMTYKDTEYTYNERNITRLDFDSGIDVQSGFHNQKKYATKRIRKELGTKQRYGLMITNSNEEAAEDIEVEIVFPEKSAVGIMQGGETLRLYENTFTETITLEGGEEELFEFQFVPQRTGMQNITSSVIAKVKGHRMKWKESAAAGIIYDTLIPRTVFEKDDVNETAEIIMYLTNPNDQKAVQDVHFTTKLMFGDEAEMLEYIYPEADLRSSLLINTIERRITSPDDTIIIEGSFMTEFGEKIAFRSETTAANGTMKDFRKIEESVLDASNYDTRHEIEETEPETFLGRIAAMTEGSGEGIMGQIGQYVLPIGIFTVIMLLQGTIFYIQWKKRKRPAEEKKK
ncbi:MAG: hypothetical protein ACOC32_01285 [Nanoarchaeota archaeon]